MFVQIFHYLLSIPLFARHYRCGANNSRCGNKYFTVSQTEILTPQEITWAAYKLIISCHILFISYLTEISCKHINYISSPSNAIRTNRTTTQSQDFNTVSSVLYSENDIYYVDIKESTGMQQCMMQSFLTINPLSSRQRITARPLKLIRQ